MKLARRKRPQPLVPLASMGDIAFLLIIFFMLTSNFMRESHIRVDPPGSRDIEVQEQSQVFVTMDEEGVLFVQGEELNVGLLENRMRHLLDTRKDKLVMVKIDKGVPQKQFGPILMALSKARAEIALVGKKEK